MFRGLKGALSGRGLPIIPFYHAAFSNKRVRSLEVVIGSHADSFKIVTFLDEVKSKLH